MKLVNTEINGLRIFEPEIYTDGRGWFLESYNKYNFIESNIFIDFVQDNHSLSLKKGTLRGLHFQNHPFAQTKLVRCTRGRIWDVAVDLRKSSPTYLKWFGLELSSDNHRMLLIPQGFAHGFITLEDYCEVQYKVDKIYNKSSDRSIIYNDPLINIGWPIDDIIISEKDKNAPSILESDVNF